MKLINRFHAYHNGVHAEHERTKKRLIEPPDKFIEIKKYWKIDEKFNPFYVRRRAKNIAKSIALKIKEKTYVPNEPHKEKIPKSGGGSRELTIFQIPDAAVSRYFYSRLLAKNKHRFSSFSYAYRNDRNVHFAIQDISVDLQNDTRTFIAEFDYSDFFGSISHDFLFKQFKKNGFFITAEEEAVIVGFLKHRDVGIPQGTSISLFLANLVCWRLDQTLEKAGLKFARYADDTIIWSSDYSAICRSFNIIDDFSRSTGVAINRKKSAGINLLSSSGLASEISSKEYFDFLGYSISPDKVFIKRSAEDRIKKQISYLLYRNLISPVKKLPLIGLIIPGNNKDPALLTAIMQIRRYLYGELLNRDLIDFIKGRRKYLQFKGVMSFYPLVNDREQLTMLDGWLVSVIYRAIQKRAALLVLHGYDRYHSFPFSLAKKDLLEGLKKKKIKGKSLLEIPSFTLIFEAINKGLQDFGIERVMHPDSIKYDY